MHLYTNKFHDQNTHASHHESGLRNRSVAAGPRRSSVLTRQELQRLVIGMVG